MVFKSAFLGGPKILSIYIYWKAVELQPLKRLKSSNKVLCNPYLIRFHFKQHNFVTPQMAGHKPSQLCSASVWSENSLQSDEHPEIFHVTLLLNVMNYSTNKIVIRTKFFNLSSLCVHQRLAQALGSNWLVKP